MLFTEYFEEDFSPVYKEEVFKIQYLHYNKLHYAFTLMHSEMLL